MAKDAKWKMNALRSKEVDFTFMKQFDYGDKPFWFDVLGHVNWAAGKSVKGRLGGDDPATAEMEDALSIAVGNGMVDALNGFVYTARTYNEGKLPFMLFVSACVTAGALSAVGDGDFKVPLAIQNRISERMRVQREAFDGKKPVVAYKTATPEDDPHVAAYEFLLEENETLKGEMEEVKRALSDAKSKAAAAEKKVDLLRERLAEAEGQRDAARASVDEALSAINADLAFEKEYSASLEARLKDALGALDRAEREAAQSAKPLPAAAVQPLPSPEAGIVGKLLDEGAVKPPAGPDAVKAAMLLRPDAFRFSRKALKDAAAFAGDPAMMLRALLFLADDFLPQARLGNPPESRMLSKGSAFEVSANESQATSTGRRTAEERCATIGGRKVSARYHLKAGPSTVEKALRVHFSFDREEGTIDVVRCGNHLPSANRGGK